MPYLTATTQARLGGGKAHSRFASLFDAMHSVGFDPSVSGSEWMLCLQDIHYSTDPLNHPFVLDAELVRLAEHPPVCVVGIGDFLRDYSTAFGFGPYTVPGLLEIANANAHMPKFAALAPIKAVTGNHDAGPNENPPWSFMAANAPWWTASNHNWVCGGVSCAAISTGNDGGCLHGQELFIRQAIESAGDGEVAIFGHQPSFMARANEQGIKDAVMAETPEGFTNPMWHFCGHGHEFLNVVYTLKDTTLVLWEMSATIDYPSPDNSKCALGALACRGGKIVGRFGYDGNTAMWTVVPPPNRANATPIPGRFDGLPYPRLSTYLEGYYDRTGKILTPVNTTWRDTGTWMAYVGVIKVAFPIPSGATKFWLSAAGAIATPEMSNVDGSWQAATLLSYDRQVFIYDIPVSLRAGETLYFQGNGGASLVVGGWGFS
jgi:hypothetical protein